MKKIIEIDCCNDCPKQWWGDDSKPKCFCQTEDGVEITTDLDTIAPFCPLNDAPNDTCKSCGGSGFIATPNGDGMCIECWGLKRINKED